MGKSGKNGPGSTQPKKAKGHRQRGAGTVVTSKGPREMSVGDVNIVLREWQKLPSTILHEHCQSAKRPKPKFTELKKCPPGRHKFRVILQDPKRPGTDKDLIFVPDMDSDSASDAKQCAALLSLAHVCKTLPLERKLPDIYKDMWLSLVSGKPATTRAPKPPPGAAAAAAASAKPPAVPKASAAAAFSAGWDDGSSGDEEASVASKPLSKAASMASRQLGAVHKHASVAEAKQARASKQQEHAKRRNAREAKLNQLPSLMLSTVARETVEAALRTADADGTMAAARQAEAAASAHAGPARSGHTAKLADVAKALQQQGWQQEHAVAALAASLERSAEQRVLHVPPHQSAHAAAASAQTAATDWLSLRVAPAEAPAGFAGAAGVRVVTADARASDELIAWGAAPRDAQLAATGSGGSLVFAAWRAAALYIAALQAAQAVDCGAGLAHDAGPGSAAQDWASLEEVQATYGEAGAAPGIEDMGIFVRELHGLKPTHFDGLPGGAGELGPSFVGAQQLLHADSASAGAPGRLVHIGLCPGVQLLALQGQDLGAAPACLVKLDPSAAAAGGLPSLRRWHGVALTALLSWRIHVSQQCSTMLDAALWAQTAAMDLSEAASADVLAAGAASAWSQGVHSLCGATYLALQVFAFPLLDQLEHGLHPTLVLQPGARELASAGAAAGASTGRGALPDTGSASAAQRMRASPYGAGMDKAALAARQAALAAGQARLRAAQGGDAEWRALCKQRADLPVAALRGQVLDVVNSAQVSLVSGATGSGKSTQVPQFLLEDAIAKGKGAAARIVVTQPRRLAATSLAARVAAERGEAAGARGSTPAVPGAAGNCVGHHVRGDRSASGDTSIVFVTVGILLRQLQSGVPAGITHIVVDEVHERSADTDFLLCTLKRLLSQGAKVRVVLMSATMQASTFARYFSSVAGAVPLVDVPGRTFPVRDLYLDDMLAAGAWQPTGKLRRSADDGSVAIHAGEVMRAGLDFATLAAAVRWTMRTELGGTDGAVLVFMPGVPEIRRLARALADVSGIQLLQLYGGAPPGDQAAAFRPARRGLRKVVLSTNVAETSLTLPDVTVVIDSCRVKQTEYDPVKGLAALAETWASQAACNQRKGRAGRVRPGTAVRMVSRAAWTKLAAHTAPEVARMPLEGLALQTMALGLGQPDKILSQLPTPAPGTAVLSAIAHLRQLGAIQGKPGDISLTSLGTSLSRLPIDPRLGKLLVLSALFQAVAPVLTIAAALIGRSPFRNPGPDRERQAAVDAAKSQVMWDRSDHLTLVAAWQRWHSAGSAGARRAVADQLCLSHDACASMADARAEFAKALADAGLIPRGNTRDLLEGRGPCNTNGADPALLRGLLVAALYPRIVKIVAPPRKYQKAAYGKVAQAIEAGDLRMYTLASGAGHELDLELPEGGGGSSSAGPRSARASSVAGGSDSFSRSSHRITQYRGVEMLRVWLHPGSVCAGIGEWPCPFAVYHTRVATSRTFVRDASAVPPYALLLFTPAEILVDHHDSLLHLDQRWWVTFRAPPHVAVLTKRLRQAFSGVIARAIHDSSYVAGSSPVTQAVMRLVRGMGS